VRFRKTLDSLVEDREANDAESDRMGDFQLIAEEHRQLWLTAGYAVLAYEW